MKVEKLVREFKYNGIALADPDPAQSPDEVRTFYAGIYPELNNAEIEGPEHKGEKAIYEFRKAVGRKGAQPQGPRMGRISFRTEGDWWNCYFAKDGLMEGAYLLGTIRMFAVENQERRQAFIALMQEVMSDVTQQATGIRPEWGDPEPAPEHERSGHG